MFFIRLVPLATVLALLTAVLSADSKKGLTNASAHAPTYTSDGRLNFQQDYREWVYLSSGLDMSYTPRASTSSDHPVFDNVFVNPEAYRAFLQTGTWPDKTTLVLEVRESERNASINKGGHSQSQKVSGLEIHVKDAAHGGWAFYDFDGKSPAKIFPKNADCYSCHRDHGAVDTTFVQFYPTLLPIAKQNDTISKEYQNSATKNQ